MSVLQQSSQIRRSFSRNNLERPVSLSLDVFPVKSTPDPKPAWVGSLAGWANKCMRLQPHFGLANQATR
jgi:hypothetical protein